MKNNQLSVNNEDNMEEEVNEVKVTDASPSEVQKQSKTFFERLGDGVQFLSEAENLDQLLQMYDYTEKEQKMFTMGIKSVLASTFTKVSKADMDKYLNNTYARIRFVESIMRLIHLKIIPNTSTYYIAPRKITNKKTGETNYDFKIDLQYQAKIDALEARGIEIIRAEYITADEWHEDLEDISSGEVIINHKPNLINRKKVVESNKPADIVASYVVYRQFGKIKYFKIDYERIHKAKSASIKQKSSSINWSGTGGDGAKKTVVHRLFDLVIYKNLEDSEEDYNMKVVGTEISKQKEKESESLIEEPEPLTLMTATTRNEEEGEAINQSIRV